MRKQGGRKRNSNDLKQKNGTNGVIMLSYDEDGLILNVLLLELRMVRTEVAGCVTRVLPSRKEAQCLMTETEAKQKKTTLCTTTIPKNSQSNKSRSKAKLCRM